MRKEKCLKVNHVIVKINEELKEKKHSNNEEQEQEEEKRKPNYSS